MLKRIRVQIDDVERVADMAWGKTTVDCCGCWLWCGEYDQSLLLDHRCRNRNCVNPDHLEPVTHQENTLRGNAVLFKKVMA